MVALFEKPHTRKRAGMRVSKEPRDPKDGYRDEGVAKVLRAARARVIDEPMTADEMMRVIRRG